MNDEDTNGDQEAKLNEFAIEEYRALRIEIDYLGKRSETAQYTAILANAALLSLVFLGASLPAAGIAIGARLEAVSELDVEIVVILLLFNILMGLKIVSLEQHVDKIGEYVCRIETFAYREPSQRGLGWETYQRSSFEGVKGGRAEKFRRYVVWAFLTMLNLVALAYINWPFLMGLFKQSTTE